MLPPPSAQAVGALVAELRTQLGMALFGVDVILNIHTHTLTVIDINIFPGEQKASQAWEATERHLLKISLSVFLSYFQNLWNLSSLSVSPPGYEGVPQFFSFLLSHIESVLDTREDPQAAGLPASQATGPPDPQTDPQSLGHCDPQDAGNPASQATCSTAPPSPRTTL